MTGTPNRDSLGGLTPRSIGRPGRRGARRQARHLSFFEAGADPFPDTFFLRECSQVARDLLGSRVRSTVAGSLVEGMVVEAEAYVGPHDPASHAAYRIGRTARNGSMFGPPGSAYVYRSYGIHWCLNVVTGEEGYPAAVLLRGLEIIDGEEVATARRGGKEPLGAGPGRLCQALGVTGELDGHPLSLPPLVLRSGWRVPDEAVAISGRVGIKRAVDWPLRFYLRGHAQVSRGPREIRRSAPFRAVHDPTS